MPDTWGRTLMKRREVQLAITNGTKARTLYDIDFLLGVYDETRMGAFRFKLDPSGDFLDNNSEKSTPPWSNVRELQQAVVQYGNYNFGINLTLSYREFNIETEKL